MANLAWTATYARAEEEFLRRLGAEDEGWLAETQLHMVHLQVQMEESEVNKAARWREVEAMYAAAVEGFSDRTARWEMRRGSGRKSGAGKGGFGGGGDDKKKGREKVR